MEFTKLVKEYNRMCETTHCLECPINGVVLKHELHNEFDYMTKYPEEFAETIEKWSKENPAKTNGDKLKEMISETFGIPAARLDVGSCSLIACDGYSCKECECEYRDFWDKEYKEVK